MYIGFFLALAQEKDEVVDIADACRACRKPVPRMEMAN